METSVDVDYVPLFVSFLEGKSPTIGDKISHDQFPDGDDLELPAAVIRLSGGLVRMRLMLLVRAEKKDQAFASWQPLNQAINSEAPDITNVRWCVIEDGSPIRTEDSKSRLPEILSYYNVELI
jgi:hypothetical protein